jgi:hypothetical protein
VYPLVPLRGSIFLVRTVNLREKSMEYSRRNRRIYLCFSLSLLLATHPLVGHTSKGGYVFCLESSGQLQIEASDDEMSCERIQISPTETGISIRESSSTLFQKSHCGDCIDLPFYCQDNDRTLKPSGNVLSHLRASFSKLESFFIETIEERSVRIFNHIRSHPFQFALVFLRTTNLLI